MGQPITPRERAEQVIKSVPLLPANREMRACLVTQIEYAIIDAEIHEKKRWQGLKRK